MGNGEGIGAPNEQSLSRSLRPPQPDAPSPQQERAPGQRDEDDQAAEGMTDLCQALVPSQSLRLSEDTLPVLKAEGRGAATVTTEQGGLPALSASMSARAVRRLPTCRRPCIPATRLS